MNLDTWSLAAVETRDGDVAAALLDDGATVAIDVLPAGISPLAVVKRWEEFSPRLQSWRPNAARTLSGALKAPIRYPAKLICAGANYRDHRGEMHDGGAAREPGLPFVFFKPPTTTIIGPGDDILIRGKSDQVDWEAEIAVVIGKGGRFIDEADAISHIAGYTLVNDVSARAVFEQPHAWNPAMAYDWVAQKAQDTFCPIGPGMLPFWFIPDPDDIDFSLTVNGVVEQAGSTKHLIFGVRAIISAASQLMTLEPGDIIATGTPGGVGAAKGRFLADGDEVIVSSPHFGSLRNRVRDLARECVPAAI